MKKGDIKGAENKADDDEEERNEPTRNMRATVKYKMVTKTKPEMMTRDTTRETMTKQEMETIMTNYNKNREDFDEEEKGDVEGAENMDDGEDDEEEEEEVLKSALTE
jgi:hypothetical protein